MKPRFRLKWDKFICWLFDHRWIDSAGEDDEYLEEVLVSTWRVCLRCARVEKVFYPPPALTNCQAGFVGLIPTPKELEFIEFQKITRKQIIGGKDAK